MTTPAPFAFENTPRFTRAQADLLNWFQRAAPEAASWRRWVRAVLSDALEYPVPPEVWLEETHCLGQRDPVRHNLNAERVTIGRGEDAGIVAVAPAIAREHARLHRSGASCKIEDLDSKIGTFLGGRKLAPGKPEPLKDGDRFTIFPYNYQLHVEQRWRKEDNVDLMAGPAAPAVFSVFRTAAGAGRMLRGIAVEPSGTGLALETSTPFVRELARRTLYPAAAGSALGELEQAAAEYLLISVAERASRDVAFPFQVSVLAAGSLPAIQDDEEGLALSCTIGLSDLTGLVRVFVPRRLLEVFEQWTPAREAPPPVAWRCVVEVGALDLTPAELRSLEPGDVVLYAPGGRIALPGGRRFRRGEIAGEGNFRLKVTDDWDELAVMSAPMSETLDQPRLDELPVRVSIIAGEREMSYGELKQLSPGSIIELDRGPEDPVSIALNGKVAGRGELVRIDDRLGVRIVAWKEPS